MNKNGLEDCPFCGGDDVELIQSKEEGCMGWSVECPDCGTCGPEGDLGGARRQWNCWLTENRSEFEKENKIALAKAYDAGVNAGRDSVVAKSGGVTIIGKVANP